MTDARPDASGNYQVHCSQCRSEANRDTYHAVCPDCGGALEFEYGELTRSSSQLNSIWRYSNVLPINDRTKIVSLGEGMTPLLRSRLFPGRNVFLKNETTNPTGSHKDRSLSVAISKAVEFGFNTCMLYSDGSAALASAAYAARAGIRHINLTAAGAPAERLLPLMAYGSTILEYQGGDDEALQWVHEVCSELGIYETTTYRRANPYGAEGPKTIGYEIVEDFGGIPDYVVVPVGGGGTLAGIWQAFLDMKDAGLTQSLPRMVGVLPAGYRLLEIGLEKEAKTASDLRRMNDFEIPASEQVKLAMTFPPDGIEAIKAIRDSCGCFVYASDAEALVSQQELGRTEGIYAEISASVSVSAIHRLIETLKLGGESIVGLVCGSGFRETGVLGRSLSLKKTPIYAETKPRELEGLLALSRRNNGMKP